MHVLYKKPFDDENKSTQGKQKLWGSEDLPMKLLILRLNRV